MGARLVPFAGWEMPLQYTGIVDEHVAVRTAAGLFDVSHMGELRLRGPYAGHVIDYLVTNDVKRLERGGAIYTCACGESGMILDDLIVYRVGDEDWLVVCNGANRDKMSAHFARAAKDHCEIEDQSDGTSLLALQGPRAFEVLAALGAEGVSLSSLPSFHLRSARLAGVPCTVARTGYTGEDGVEIFCPWDDAPVVWRALLGAGRPFGLRAVGLGARDTLRLEARLSLYGNDIDETTNPLEAGLGWVVKLDKGDFIGREALLRARREPLSRRLVGFEMVGRGIARHGYALQGADLAPVGVCTSGSPGPTVGKNIGLGYLPLAMTEVGDAISRRLPRQEHRGRRGRTPFYKRQSQGARA